MCCTPDSMLGLTEAPGRRELPDPEETLTTTEEEEAREDGEPSTCC